MNKKAVEQLSEAVCALRANGFETLSEAAVFCVAATATVDGKLCAVTELSLAAKIPNSSVSRVVWDLNRRGLLEYVRDAGDRRIKRLHAQLDAFEWS